jgi:thiamine-phosphate pyrophosphorylase
MKFKLPPIYPITDKKLANRTSHLSILKELVRGGAQLVQVRDKCTPARDLLDDLLRCVEFAADKGVILIVNDRCDLVLGSGADGVHIGQDDIPPGAARSILGRRKIIGVSAHTVAHVRKALQWPIQYLGFGPVYATSTKENPPPVAGLPLLAKACKESSLPIVAIGGISLERVREVLNAGAASAAVISALMKAPNLARQMEVFLNEAREK